MTEVRPPGDERRLTLEDGAPKLWQVAAVALIAIMFTAVSVSVYRVLDRPIWSNAYVTSNHWVTIMVDGMLLMAFGRRSRRGRSSVETRTVHRPRYPQSTDRARSSCRRRVCSSAPVPTRCRTATRRSGRSAHGSGSLGSQPLGHGAIYAQPDKAALERAVAALESR